MPHIELNENLPGIRALLAYQSGNGRTHQCSGRNPAEEYKRFKPGRP